MLESGEESYHIEELGKELNKSLVNNRTKEEYLVFRADNLPYSMTRGVRAIYELPAHDEDSQSNTIYKNGFEVAKYIANKIDKPKDLNNPDRKSEYYLQDWSTLMADIEQEAARAPIISRRRTRATWEPGGSQRGGIDHHVREPVRLA